MNKFRFADVLAIAKSIGYSGLETPDQVEAIRSFIIASKKIVNGSDGKAVEWTKAIIEDEPLVIKAVSVSVSADVADVKEAVNKTNDLDTLIKSGVQAELAKARGHGNPNANVLDRVEVIEVEEALYNTSRKHFRDYPTAKRFRDALLMKMGTARPEFAENEQVVKATKRWNSDPVVKAYGTTTQAGGGALAFMQFIPDVIQNFVQYGVSRQLAQVWPMTQEIAYIPKQTGIQTVSYPAQSGTISQSTGVTFSNVALTAKTGTCIIKASMQLMQDANILIANNFMEQLVRAFAYTEDQAMFNGNGEAALGGVIGLYQRFLGVSATLVAAGNVIGGSSWDGHTMTNLTTVYGLLPDYARANAKWVCNPAFLGTLHRLGLAQGGVTFRETMDQGYVPYFMGKPVITANVVNGTNAASNLTVDLYYGDFSRAVAIGDRLGLQLDVSDQRYWDDYSIGIRGVMRHDVQVHDVGTLAAAGPVITLSQS